MENKSVINSKPSTIDLLDYVATGEKPALEVLRLGASDVAVVPFTSGGIEVSLHFCEEPDVRGYVHCLERDCPLCGIGREKVKRLLLPVYVPTAVAVQVLSVSTAKGPRSLLPQLFSALGDLKESNPRVVFIRREGAKFTVKASPLPDNIDGGETVVKSFVAEFDADHINLASVFPRLDRETLIAVPEIATLLKLRGLV